jgi:hypothetical protein
MHYLGALALLYGLLEARKESAVLSGPLRGALAGGAILSLATGAHNFMTGMKDAPEGWHAVAGIKILLAMHAVAVALLAARGGLAAGRRARMAKGALVSLAITAVLGLGARYGL